MIGEKTLGEKLAKRLDAYSEAWGMVTADAARTPDQRKHAAIMADVLRVLATVIREVTQ